VWRGSGAPAGTNGNSSDGGVRVEGVTWDAAQRLVGRGVELGRERELSMTIAVLDGGRELKAFGRADGAMLVTIQFAIGKAYTACSMNRTTDLLAERTWSGGDLHGLETAHSPALVPIGGGAPLRSDGQLVGAVGVSGGTPIQDHELAVELARLYEAGEL
jgi:uncharacterized protein GlcG (DUF336 family)